MNDDLLISIAFPGDTYSKILQELEQYDSQKMDESLIFIRKSIAFFLDFSFQIASHDRDSFTCNINLISSKDLAECFFNNEYLDIILDFLKKYDNSYFWGAFGINMEKGNYFFKKMNSDEDKSEIFKEIHSEIINSDKLNKEVILNDLFDCMLLKKKPTEDSNEAFSYLVFILHEVCLKYPSVEEALRMVEADENGWPKVDLFSLKHNFDLLKEKCHEISPEILFDLIKNTDSIASFARNSCIIHNYLTNAGETEKRILLNTFKIHRYGYEAYQIYLVWCKGMKVEPALKIGNNPECYFYNSYKVPQIKSLYKRYFSELSDKEAKKKTKECFEEIYDNLREEGFLDKECRREEFLWAFGLTDEYPFAFKKIKFKTLSGRNNKDKGNGAFLCFLTILGYTSEEIKAMLNRNPDKSLINKTFDLTIKDNTVMSKDHKKILEIVKSSGLPIQ